MTMDEALAAVRQRFPACPSSFHQAKRWLERQADELGCDMNTLPHRHDWWAQYRAYNAAWQMLHDAEVAAAQGREEAEQHGIAQRGTGEGEAGRAG